MSGPPSVVTPPELLLAIAEHEELAKTCAALPGMTRERAQQLLRGVALSLQRAAEPVAPTSRKKPAATKSPDVERSEPPPPRQRMPDHLVYPPATLNRLIVYSDGASRGNPGPAGAGAVICDERGLPVEWLGKYLGSETNNIAEYQGVLLGLRGALELGGREIEVRADSELMIRQLRGEYRVKNEGLKPLFAEAQALLRKFEKVKLTHVRRELNKMADEMSNRAIDEKM